MAAPKLPDEIYKQTLSAVAQYGSTAAAARALGVVRTTFDNRYQRARLLFPETPLAATDDWQADEPAAEFPILPSDEPSYEELKAASIRDFQRLHEHREQAKLLTVKVKIEGPYGVMVTGDPHVDSPGTDWPLLDKHTAIIKRTEGLFGANVGDITNNWISRLARLYGEQNMGRKRALILAEGWLREVRWLWIDPGNHDLWSGADDPVRWITRFAGIHYKWQGSRLQLTPPSGRSVIVNSRHDHPGHSQYHPTHGPLKASIWDGWNDDIYTCGHIHSGGYMYHVHNNGKSSHIVRLSSYKVYDNHKDERGFREASLPAGILLINPDSRGLSAAHWISDVEWGADCLTWMRKQHARGKSVETPRK